MATYNVPIRIEMEAATAPGRSRAQQVRASNLPGVQRDIMRRTKNVARVARATAPVRTGKLRATIRADKTVARGVMSGRVSVGGRGVPYASPVLFGARPHIIEARRGGALRFEAGGRIVFARRVQHPGNRPNPFLVRALRAARG